MQSMTVTVNPNRNPDKLLSLIRGRVSEARVVSNDDYDFIIIEDDNLNRVLAVFLELDNLNN